MIHAESASAAAQMQPVFDRALAQIQKEIEAWYQRFAENNQISLIEAKKLLKAKELKELKWDIDEYIQYGRKNAIDPKWLRELENASARYHISRLEALKIRTQNAAERAFGSEAAALNALTARVYTDDYYHVAYEIQKGIGIGWNISHINQDELDKLIARPWTADGLTFSDRIWKSKVQLIDALQTELTQMCILGKSPDASIANIAQRMNVAKSQAGRLIMTESAYFASAAQKDCFRNLDVEQYEIVATLDSHTSAICQEMDGKVFKMSDFQAGVTAPPFHVYCRSTTVPYFDDEWGREGTRAARGADGKTYQVPADMKYQTWASYNNAVAHEPQITAALMTMANRMGQELTGLEYRLKTPESFTRKVNKEAAEFLMIATGATYEDAYQYAISIMYDTVRYTALINEEKFTKNYNLWVHNLKKAGYNIGRVKNSFPDVNALYRGLNTIIITPDGFNFELQFHTPESLKIKNKTHLLYEEFRRTTTTPARRKELEQQMRALSSRLRTPKDAESILPIDNLKGR